MLSEKNAALWVRILILVLAAVFSFFIAASMLPKTGFVQGSLESLEESSDMVMKFSAVTLSTSLAISALPDDFATPLAESLSDMNIYFIAILVVLFFEKLLLQYGVKLAFVILIPAACAIGVLFVATQRGLLKGLAIRLCILGLAVALVVPCSTHLTDYVAADLMDYVSETIEETENDAGKLSEAMEDSSSKKSIFEHLSDLFHTAVNSVSDLMTYFQNTIRRCMNAIAILILTNCLMPLLTLFVLKWILREVFQIVLPMPSLKKRRPAASDAGASDAGSAPEFAFAGGNSHEH